MLHPSPHSASAHVENTSWFEQSWGDGPFSFSETVGMVLASNDPVVAANKFHALDTKTGERISLRDFLRDIQRPGTPREEISPQTTELLEQLLEPMAVATEIV